MFLYVLGEVKFVYRNAQVLKSTAAQILAKDVCNQRSILTYAMTFAY